jgi:hypothetical protein
MNNISRLKAASIHLAISAVIALAACTLILFIWYPSPLFSAVGGKVLLGIIIGVDVCIGPSLTLIVFNPKKLKKLLILDLSVIAMLQTLALAYGLYTTFEARPAFIVYNQGAFTVMLAKDYEEKWLQDAKDPRYQTLPTWGPRWVGIRKPTDKSEIGDTSFWQSLMQLFGVGIESQPKYYTELSVVQEDIAKNARSIQGLRTLHPEASSQMDKALNKAGKKPEEVGYLPLRTKQESMAVLVDKHTGVILDTLDINPETANITTTKPL